VVGDNWRERSDSPTASATSEIVRHPFSYMLPVTGDKAKITCLTW
jgi:hypothetical protein